ncbi:protein tincar isoform X2 [Agrilus planipennis]|uniref:Protein tincar isoform X2 n=1 Tax=Agrilus planipennis TaxID=224129 RepID=A0A1W4XS43_AGRPL|nr:protein tincar isoform X2 [Agrilus planipennis]
MSSISGSIVGYENNNEINRNKVNNRPNVVHLNNKRQSDRQRRKMGLKCCTKIHLNNLWSLWYGFTCTIFQAYVGVKCVRRILGYSLLPWSETTPVPLLELNISLGLTVLAVLLLPIFLCCAVFKIGNLANDGFKLGSQLSICSKDQTSTLGSRGGCSLWKHGGPTAPFIHLVIAFCLLLPKLLMEARLIEAGFVQQETIWRTDLDFMMAHKDRLVVLSFMTATNSTPAPGGHVLPSALPVVTTTDEERIISANDTTLGPTALPLTGDLVKDLRDIVGHDQQDYTNNNVDTGWGCSVSVEFMNFGLALLVYSVRYPAVFWATNKTMGMLFSMQFLINSLQILLAYAGMSVLYRVQVVGVWKVLPLLKPQPGGVSPLGGISPFLLNPQVTLALYILYSLLVLSSSLVLYLYGYTRFNAFLNQERERKIIALKAAFHTSRWSYFTHCAALCALVSIGVSSAPLLHDYTIIYKGSLDGAVLTCVVGSILHLFLWVVLWLFLTIKQKWTFKLRVSVGRATIRQARHVKLVTDVDLANVPQDDPSLQPLLVVGNGRTYTVAETSPKKAIMGIIQKTTILKKTRSENNSVITEEEDEEQIYWLRPAISSVHHSPDGSKQLCWFNKKPKSKVSFDEATSTSAVRNKGNVCRGKRLPGMEIDEGDYATLRELPVPATNIDLGDDTASEEGKGSGQTPKCLRRADSGMPHDELTPRSDSVSTECSQSPPDPPGSNHSETSSGVHSNESSELQHNQMSNSTTKRATSVADLAQPMSKEEIQWRSCSLQRNTQPPGSTIISPIIVPQPQGNNVSSPQPNPYTLNNGSPYSNLLKYNSSPANTTTTSSVGGSIVDHGIPAVILENPAESTVVIRRKVNRPVPIEPNQVVVAVKDEPFGRATNMRMTSFTESGDLRSIQASSATLPHYPTQPVQSIYPHCSTMPLPQQHTTTPNGVVNLGTGNSCNIYPRQHTTIPTHHNGVRLFNGIPTPNPYIKRLQFQTGPVRVNANEPIYTGVNRVSGEMYHYNT